MKEGMAEVIPGTRVKVEAVVTRSLNKQDLDPGIALRRRWNCMLPLTLPPEPAADLEGLARDLDLADFDLLLVGSGTVYGRPVGRAWPTTAAGVRPWSTPGRSRAVRAPSGPHAQAVWHRHQVRGLPLEPWCECRSSATAP
jgi:hypothetical protein